MSNDDDWSPDDWYNNFWDVLERWAIGLLSTDDLEICLHLLGEDLYSFRTEHLIRLYFENHLTNK